MDWHAIARALSVKNLSGTSLPASGTCPLCDGNRLTFHQDTISKGVWHYCFHCRTSGDMVDLASAVWQTEPHIALYRLAEQGVNIRPDKLEERKHLFHRSCWLATRARALEYWEACRQHLVAPNPPRLLALRQRLGLQDTGISRKRLLEGPGRFYGASDAHTTAAQLGGESVVTNRHTPRFFGSQGWRDILVIPHWGSPSHIMGFEFVGRLGRPHDTAYRVIAPTALQPSTTWGGIAGLLPVLQDTENLAIAVPDVLAMCCLQTRYFRHAVRPLPLVAWDHKRPPNSQNWANLSGRNVVFWDFALMAETVVCAAQHDAYLVVAGPENITRADIDRYLRSMPALDLVRQLEKHARPWRAAIRNWARRRPSPQVQQLLDRLESLDTDIAREARACLPASQRQGERMQIRQASIGLVQVVERGGRWYRESPLNRRDDLLFDGVIRVHRVLLHEQEPTEYLGEVIKPLVGEAQPVYIPFHLDEAQMGDVRLWAKKAIWEHTGEQTQDKTPREWYSTPLKDVALAFQRPKIERGIEAFGWDGRGFQFRHYRIEYGQFISTDTCLLPKAWPAPDRGMPKASKLLDMAIGVNNLEMRYLWAIVNKAVEAAQAAARGLPATKVILPVQGTTHALTGLLWRLGLPCHPKQKDGHITNLIWPHRWPVVLAPGSKLKNWVEWFVETAMEPTWLVLYESRRPVSCPLTEGMIRIERPPLLNLGRLTHPPIHKIIPLYLRWWTDPRNNGGTVRDWLKSRGIPTTAFDQARLMVTEG